MVFRESKEICACGSVKSQVAKICLGCRRKRVSVICGACGERFECRPSQMREACCRECAYRLRARRSSNTQSKRVELVCEHCGKRKLVSPAYSTRRFCSPNCANAANTGENNPRWKGGITSEHQAFFSSPEWKRVCASVWARDRRTCRRCGAVHNGAGQLHEVHHTGSWAKFPEHRLNLDNLVLLCRKCHRWIHSRDNTRREFIRHPR